MAKTVQSPTKAVPKGHQSSTVPKKSTQDTHSSEETNVNETKKEKKGKDQVRVDSTLKDIINVPKAEVPANSKPNAPLMVKFIFYSKVNAKN